MRRLIPVLFTLTILVYLFPSLLHSQTFSKVTPRLQQQIQESASDETLLVWVYFADKGDNLSEKLNQVEATLTEKAYRRRLRNRGANHLVDYYDIPVNSEYVNDVASLVNRVRHKSRWLNAVSVEATPQQIQTLSQRNYVKKLDRVFTKTEPLPVKIEGELTAPPLEKSESPHSFNYGFSYDQINQINVIPLHDMGLNGSGVTIAMLDAGFNNLQHEALSQLNILHTWDFVNGDSIVSDEPGQMGTGNHGTYTLSALAGFQEGSLIGPAFGADFLLAKTENTDWERHIEEDAWVAGAEWADSLGADIISSSLGYRDGFTNGEPNYTWQDMDGNTTIVAIGADIAASRGILVVNSAGNEGPANPPENTLVSPADGDSVLAVGAVTASGSRASFSSMGPTSDGQIKPDVMARGVSTACASPYDPHGYVSVSGTSLSCPLVAGAAALVLQANPNLTNMEIIEALHQTASQANTPDNEYGWGIINAFDAAMLYNGIPVVGEPPTTFELYQNYPNPFNASTTILFFLPETAAYRVEVYNLLGEKIATLREGVKSGFDVFVWDASNLSSGIYFIALRSKGQIKVKKAMLIK